MVAGSYEKTSTVIWSLSRAFMTQQPPNYFDLFHHLSKNVTCRKSLLC